MKNWEKILLVLIGVYCVLVVMDAVSTYKLINLWGIEGENNFVMRFLVNHIGLIGMTIVAVIFGFLTAAVVWFLRKWWVLQEKMVQGALILFCLVGKTLVVTSNLYGLYS